MHRGFLAASIFAAALAVASTPVRADQDAVQFFHDIESTPDQPVHDAVCFFCSAHIQGNADGDIVVFFGDVELNGMAHHDVVDFFGSVTASDNSSIGGDLVNFFGSIHLGQDVAVRKDVVAMFGTVNAPASVSVGGNRVNFSPLIFYGPLLVFILVIYVIVHELRMRRHRRFMQQFPIPPPPSQ